MRTAKVLFVLWSIFSIPANSMPTRAAIVPVASTGAHVQSVQATILKLVWIQNAVTRHAVCNDGTPAGYYSLAGSGSEATTWVIHLQGGGMCYDSLSCLARKNDPTNQNLISSSGWTATMDMSSSGIMSSDPAVNPFFANANHVYVRYCSSDLYSGTGDIPLGNTTWYFRGRTILEALLEDLGPQLQNATKVLLVGGSAGGVGVLTNLDWVAQSLKSKYGITYVKGLNDAGWFIDIPPYDPTIPNQEQQLQSGYTNWSAQNNLDLSCLAANPGNEWRCYMGSYAYPYISTPLFIYNSQFDNAALTLLGDTPPFTQAGFLYLDDFGKEMVSSLSPSYIKPVFSPMSDQHAIADHPEFSSLTVMGVSLSDMLGPWFFNLPGKTKIIESRIDLPIMENNP